MIWLILGIIVFLGTHSIRIVAPGFREQCIAKRGAMTWKGIYSLIAIIGFVLMVWGFGQARLSNIQVWMPPIWAWYITAILMWPALILIVASNIPTGRIKAAIKHPMLIAVMIWAVAHLLVNGDLASILLFGSFLLWAIIDRISAASRAAPVFTNATVKWDIAAIFGGSALYALFVFWAHQYLFGVPPTLSGG